MDEVLTRDEIYSRFQYEWVLVGDPETNEALHVLRGRVLIYSKDRDEVYRKAIELKPGQFAHFARFAVMYTGKVPAAGTAIVL